MSTEILQQSIRDIPDFPKPGIVFKDITPFLRDPVAFGVFIDLLADQYRDADLDAIVAIDARGFLFGGALARALNIGLVPVRKKGKLPSACISEEYELEYGTAIVEMHDDALKSRERVLILDDLLATGGTVAATLKLCRKLGAEPVACAFLIELSFLNGREKLGDIPIFAPIVV